MRLGTYAPIGIDVGISDGHAIGDDAVQYRPLSGFVPVGQVHGASVRSLYRLEQMMPAIEIVRADVVGEVEEVAVRVLDAGHEVGTQLLVWRNRALLVEDVFQPGRGDDDESAVALVHRPGQATAYPALLGDECMVLAIAIGQDLSGAVR
ncbi:hypothetical protein D9M71_457330 [compost metagenome]